MEEVPADMLDRAVNQTLEETDSLIKAASRLAAPLQKQRQDGTWAITECVDCGEILEHHRLPSTRCIVCQEILEYRNSGRVKRN